MGHRFRAIDRGPGPERTNEKCYYLLILLSWIVEVTTLMNASDETCCSVQYTLKLVYDEHLNSKTVCWTIPLSTVLVHWLDVQNKQLKQYIISHKTIAHALTICALKSTARLFQDSSPLTVIGSSASGNPAGSLPRPHYRLSWLYLIPTFLYPLRPLAGILGRITRRP